MLFTDNTVGARANGWFTELVQGKPLKVFENLNSRKPTGLNNREDAAKLLQKA